MTGPRKYRLLSVFSCSGGDSRGFIDSGRWDVVGTEIAATPELGDFAEFWDAGTFGAPMVRTCSIEALDTLLDGGAITDGSGKEWTLSDFDLIGGGPPCLQYLGITKGTNAHIDYAGNAHHAMFTDALEERLERAYAEHGIIGYVENPGVSRVDAVLCGAAMGLSVLRHRKVMSIGWTIPKPPHPKHQGYVRGWRHGVYRDGVWPDGRVFRAYHGAGGGKGTITEAAEALGIDWVTRIDVLVEMLPPAYGTYIGTHAAAHLDALAVRDAA